MKFWFLGLWLVVALPLAAEAPPNLVYIVSDDQTWTDFGFMGNERVHTPNLDRLADQSARFLNAYVPTSVCRPSLVTLLTGLYPHQHGVFFNHGPPGNSAYSKMASADEYQRVRQREFELIQRCETLPGLLGQRGYRSLQTGKFWEGHWRNGGFTEGMTLFEAPGPEQQFGGLRVLANGDRVAHGNGDHGLLIGRKTMQPIEDFVVDCERDGTPWMVWYAPYLPHQPHDSPERFYQQAATRPGVLEHELPYFASIAEFDDSVGRLVDLVERRSDVENTIFVLVVDNGWSPSERREKKRPEEFAHTRDSKRAPFDAGLRTPILIRWDDRIPAATHNEVVSSIDLMPTLLAATETPSKSTFPGTDLMPLMQGEELPDRAVFGAIWPGDATTLDDPGADLAYRWVRQGDWKLIVPEGEDPWGGYLSTPALFHLGQDPHEQQNRAGEPSQRARLDELQTLLDAWWSGD